MNTLESTAVDVEIHHGAYDIDRVDNLDELPEGRAVFGIFGIVDEQPVNCRYVGVAGNLRETVRHLYDEPPSGGLQKFLQGPWIPMLRYQLLHEGSGEEPGKMAEEWSNRYRPAIDEEGEYPGYYS